jgi:hypothetical protein
MNPLAVHEPATSTGCLAGITRVAQYLVPGRESLINKPQIDSITVSSTKKSFTMLLPAAVHMIDAQRFSGPAAGAGPSVMIEHKCLNVRTTQVLLRKFSLTESIVLATLAMIRTTSLRIFFAISPMTRKLSFMIIRVILPVTLTFSLTISLIFAKAALILTRTDPTPVLAPVRSPALPVKLSQRQRVRPFVTWVGAALGRLIHSRGTTSSVRARITVLSTPPCPIYVSACILPEGVV